MPFLELLQTLDKHKSTDPEVYEIKSALSNLNGSSNKSNRLFNALNSGEYASSFRKLDELNANEKQQILDLLEGGLTNPESVEFKLIQKSIGEILIKNDADITAVKKQARNLTSSPIEMFKFQLKREQQDNYDASYPKRLILDGKVHFRFNDNHDVLTPEVLSIEAIANEKAIETKKEYLSLVLKRYTSGPYKLTFLGKPLVNSFLKMMGFFIK